MEIAGHVDRQMLRHFSHIRKKAKRAALDAAMASRSAGFWWCAGRFRSNVASAGDLVIIGDYETMRDSLRGPMEAAGLVARCFGSAKESLESDCMLGLRA
jgi:hypothetical protein